MDLNWHCNQNIGQNTTSLKYKQKRNGTYLFLFWKKTEHIRYFNKQQLFEK